MLPYHFYYERLAAIGDTQSDEWRTITASLDVLRLVDDWLDLGAPFVAPDSYQFMVARALIDQLPEEEMLKPILERILIALRNEKHTSVQAIASPMLDYTGKMLEDGHYSLAHDVLTTLQSRAMRARDDQLAASASLQLAFGLRKTGQFDIAAQTYDMGA